MNTVAWALLIGLYAIIVLVGGVVGYTKARSKVSLISGLASGVALAIAAFTTLQSPISGLSLALAIAVFLLIVFAIRWTKTRAIMPAGMMTVLSLMASIVFAVALLR